MSDRRYSEREIREVFERAAREQEQAARRSEPEGLTLDEMREVAASAGIAPEFVERAAQSVALGEPEQGRTSIGPIPRGVFHTEFLPGPPTEALWLNLVSDLRRTFDAQGTVTETGRVREWRNGNLHVVLEPAGDGSRLHLRTRRNRAQSQLGLVTLLSFVSLFAVLMGTIDTDAGKLSLGVIMGVMGLLVGGNLWFGQRAWATTREAQMAEIAARATTRSLNARPTPSPARQDVPPVGTGRIDAAHLDEPTRDELATEAQPRPRTRS